MGRWRFLRNQSYAQQVEELQIKLMSVRVELERSASYYDATYRVESIGISTPREMECLTSAIGWPRMYLDAIEERLDFEGFRLADNEDLVKQYLGWWESNNLGELSGLAHLDALVYGRSYITVAYPELDAIDQATPVIQVESPLDMWADIDPRTGRVTRALRLYQDPDDPIQQWATLLLPNETVHLRYFGGRWIVDKNYGRVRHGLGAVPVVPLVNRERLSDHSGKSEITPEIRSFTDAASRTMMNMQAAAELMAVPQRVIFGLESGTLAPNGGRREVLEAYMAQILTIENESGHIGQFTAADLRNFVEVLEQIAKHVASYTGLPPQYLSFASDNPASAEAIKSAESRLVKKCERKSRMFGGSWEQVMRLATHIMTGVPAGPEVQRLQAIWRDPSTPTYASKADGVSKLYANGQGIIPKHRARQDMGYTDEEIAQMEEWDEQDREEMTRLADVLSLTAPTPTNNKPDAKSEQDKSKAA